VKVEVHLGQLFPHSHGPGDRQPAISAVLQRQSAALGSSEPFCIASARHESAARWCCSSGPDKDWKFPSAGAACRTGERRCAQIPRSWHPYGCKISFLGNSRV